MRAMLSLLLVLAWAPGCSLISETLTSPSESLSDSASDSVSESISDSSRSLSDSASTVSTSSSSGGDGGATRDEAAYRSDVRLLTRSFVREGGTELAYLTELGRVAEQHGISHWEARPGTLLAIGAGLRQAGAPEKEVGPFLERIGRGGDEAQALAQEGYRRADP